MKLSLAISLSPLLSARIVNSGDELYRVFSLLDRFLLLDFVRLLRVSEVLSALRLSTLYLRVLKTLSKLIIMYAIPRKRQNDDSFRTMVV